MSTIAEPEPHADLINREPEPVDLSNSRMPRVRSGSRARGQELAIIDSMPLLTPRKIFTAPVRDPDARDRALDFIWQIPDVLFDTSILPHLPKKPRRKLRLVMMRIVAAGMRAHFEGGSGYVSYSRTHDWYAAQHYGGDDLYTCWLITNAVDALHSADVIESDRTKPGQRGRQSRFALRPWVTVALAGEMGYRGRPGLVLRDADRRPMPIPATEETAALRADVQDIRELLRNVTIEMPVSCEQIGPHHWRVPVVNKEGEPVLDAGGKPRQMIVRQDPWVDIYRVFSRGDLQLGGRWYWWGQQLPARVRGQLKVNGRHVCELDFRAMHTRMLYALEGLDYQEDPYLAVIDYDKEHGDFGFTRDEEVKTGVNIALNARNRRSAIGAIAERLKTVDRGRLAGLISAIKAAHPAIAHHLHSDAGLMLMRHESEIALSVMRKAEARGFVALPIHDSFICDVDREAELRACMNDAWDEWASAFRRTETVVPEEASNDDVSFETFLHNPTPARARARADLSELSGCAAAFLASAERLYGARALSLADHLTSVPAALFCSSFDVACPDHIQRLFGTWGLELVGLPVPRDLEMDLYRAWGRDPALEPIPAGVIARMTSRRRLSLRKNDAAMTSTLAGSKGTQRVTLAAALHHPVGRHALDGP